MKSKTYLVTNNSEGSICVTGRTRIDIPGLCKDLPLSLPENTARQTILRLKQRYPLLKIRESQENQAANSFKANPDKGQAASSTADPAPATADVDNGSQDASSQSQASTQKSSTRKGK